MMADGFFKEFEKLGSEKRASVCTIVLANYWTACKARVQDSMNLMKGKSFVCGQLIYYYQGSAAILSLGNIFPPPSPPPKKKRKIEAASRLRFLLLQSVVKLLMCLSPIFVLRRLVKQVGSDLHTFHKVNIWYLNLNIFFNSSSLLVEIQKINKRLLNAEAQPLNFKYTRYFRNMSSFKQLLRHWLQIVVGALNLHFSFVGNK